MNKRIPHPGLSIKLLIAFGLVAVAAVVAVALISRETAWREFARFIKENQTEVPDELVTQLADLFAGQGNWDNAEVILEQASLETTEKNRKPPLLLVDNQGHIVATNWTQFISDEWLERSLTQGWPVQVDGEIVGTLVAPGIQDFPPQPGELPERLSPEGAETMNRVQQIILTVGVVTGVLALIAASVLAWGLVRPLRRLTAAAEGIARGDFTQRVPVTSGDEVGELATTFNYMATELERAENLRRNMTVDVAHELRTPLSVIRGKLEGILDGVYSATPDHLGPVLESTELLIYLVEDLRLLARAEAGQLSLDKRTISISDLLRDTQVNFDPQASDRGVTLALDLPPTLPQVQADWHRVAQVLGNLLTNALRHTPQGGCVTLSASTDENTVRASVSDTGIGIPAEERAHVFDRFWRGEKSRARTGGGTGLGLAIAKQLVELHGGTIGVESTPGAGSTFWFTLPTG